MNVPIVAVNLNCMIIKTKNQNKKNEQKIRKNV